MCPVVAVTACVSEEIDRKAKSVGMIDVIHKPATKEQLLQVMRTVFFTK